ncbi:MAG: hypothetical protein Q8P41_10220 [Pseudomonadota bacterium]|nr:hypothetical protein [Pseudomonadota bacterium]
MLPMLIACPADRLGVEVPLGGVDTISAEDLQRDAYALTRPEADVAAVFERRLTQMHLPPGLTGDGRVCAAYGSGGRSRIVLAPWPTEGPSFVEDAARAAILISVAKGWDGHAPPADTTWLCLAKPGAALPPGEPLALGVTVKADRLEAIDYRKLRDDTQAFFRTLGG